MRRLKGQPYNIIKRILEQDLIYEILSVAGEIPLGCVAAYGQIAKLIGSDENAKLVGKALSVAQYYGDYPRHRVVNHAGRLSPGWREQKALLHQEGILFINKNRVDLKKRLWNC